MAERIAAKLAVFACVLAVVGCNGLDTSWHTHQGELHEEDKAVGKMEPGDDAWRLVRDAKYGETLPDGNQAGAHDVLWEWRMEVTNVSEQQFEIKCRYYLVTADKVNITVSEDPPGEETMRLIEPGKKKVFTGQGFVDKKYISRIVRGRGRFGIRPARKSVGPRKEIVK